MDTHGYVYILVTFLLGAKGFLINYNQTQGLSVSERLNALEKQLAEETRQRYLLQIEYSVEKERTAELKHLLDTVNETDQKLLQDHNSNQQRFQDISTQIRGAIMNIGNLDSKHSLDIHKVLSTLRDVMSNQSGVFQLQRHFQEKQNVLSSMLDAVKRNQSTNKENIKNLRASLVSLANSQKSLQSTVTSSSNEQTSLKAQLNKIMNPVIFLAIGSYSHYPFGSHSIFRPGSLDYLVKFGTVQINEGGGYNNNTGTFTCPSEGFYTFHWSVTPLHDHGRCPTTIIKNGISILGWEIEGNVATFHMNTNDRAWILSNSECDFSLYRTSFSGIKIV